jgi:hypothetical protein
LKENKTMNERENNENCAPPRLLKNNKNTSGCYSKYGRRRVNIVLRILRQEHIHSRKRGAVIIQQLQTTLIEQVQRKNNKTYKIPAEIMKYSILQKH